MILASYLSLAAMILLLCHIIDFKQVAGSVLGDASDLSNWQSNIHQQLMAQTLHMIPQSPTHKFCLKLENQIQL